MATCTEAMPEPGPPMASVAVPVSWSPERLLIKLALAGTVG